MIGCLRPRARGPWIPGEPWLGSLRAYRGDRTGFLVRAAREGDVVGFNIGKRVFHLVAHPEGVKRVLVDNAGNYGKETRGQDLLKPILGNGLLTAEGEAWRSQRRLAQPAFQRDRIAGFAPVMTGATRAMLDSWERRSAAFDVAAEMSRLTFRIVGLALFGTDLADTADAVGRALEVALHDRAERTTSVLDALLPAHLPTPRNLRFNRAVRALDRVVARTIAERRRAPTGDRTDLLTLLASARDEETGARLDDALLRDQVMTILLAGHETTANALSWTWYLLSKNPAVERRVREEVERVLEGREPTAEDAGRLVVTRAAIDEALRLYPPAWTLARSVKTDDTIQGVPIERGTFVLLSPWVTHRNREFWPNPEGFDPERFLAPAPERPRFAYFPFGGGARQCIGNTFALLEATVIVAMTIQRYRLELDPGHVVEPEPLITLRPREGVWMRLGS